MPLTDTAIRNAKPDEKPYKLTDGKGLYFLVNKVGKYFRFDYRYRGKRKTLALGVYPDTTLQEARDEHESARKLLRKDIDPGLHKKISKHIKTEQAANTFEFVAREWFEKYKHTWKLGHSRTITQRLEANVFPWLGGQPLAEISALETLAVLRRIEEIIRQEMKKDVRIVCQNEHFIAIEPYAPRSPFETWILPKKHSCDFDTMTRFRLAVRGTIPKHPAS